ncbi:MAG: hypothetical protein EXS32_16665 [Opitutus sp.]|nr:hypothetical protein [Pedosphaera sp.]MSU25440.1 hypothetical protein [Opitutus sp.]
MRFALLLLFATATPLLAQPSEEDLRNWLQGVEIVVGKKWFFLDRTERLQSTNFTRVKLVQHKEQLEFSPLKANLGTAWAEFRYTLPDKKSLEMEAVFNYEFKQGLTQRTRTLKPPPLVKVKK